MSGPIYAIYMCLFVYISATGPCARGECYNAQCAVLGVFDWFIIGSTPPPACVHSRTLAYTRMEDFASIFGMIFVLRFSPILVPTWPQLGPQLGAKIHQKSVQEPSKIHLNLYLVFDTLLDNFLMDFGSKLDPKITPKSIPKSIQELPNKQTTKSQKWHKTIVIYNIFVPSAIFTWVPKPWKINATALPN